MTAGRFDDGDAAVGDVAAQIAGGDDAVLQVVGIEDFFQAHGDGVEIAPGQAAVSGKAFGEDEEIGLELGDAVVVGGEQAADVGEGVFLGGESAAVGERKYFLRDAFGGPIGIAGLAFANEPGVFGEAAGVQVERNGVTGGDAAHRLGID